jgi:hypothetical protein
MLNAAVDAALVPPVLDRLLADVEIVRDAGDGPSLGE